MTAQKSVLQLNIHEKKIMKKALVTVSELPGVTSITIDDKAGKLTVSGEVDVPKMVMKLRKICNTEIVTVDVVKPPEKKPDPPKQADIVAYPMHYQYYPAYADSFYLPYANW